MTAKRVWLVVLLTAAAFSCKAPREAAGTGLEPRTQAEAKAAVATGGAKFFADDPEDFHFVVFADRSGGKRDGVFESAAAKVNLLMPSFAISVGDLLEGYAESKAELDPQYDELNGILAKLKMPFFRVAGNHELGNDFMVKDWATRFGPTYYSFVYRDVLFIVLNSQDNPKGGDYKSGFSEEQTAFAIKTLADNPNVRWTFVFMHQPLWDKQAYKDTNWEKVEAMLAGRPYSVFAGHWHTYAKYEVNGHSDIVLSTTGGDSKLHGPETGEFDEVAWVTMTDGKPVVANLALGGILPDDVATPVTAAVYDQVYYGGPVGAPAIVTEGNVFDTGKATLEMTNKTDVPMKATATFRKVEGLRVTPEAVERTVAPRSTETIAIDVAADRPTEVEAMPAVEMDWSVSYAIPDRPAISGKGTNRLVAETIHVIPRRMSPVTVDGKLDEWGEMRYTCKEPMDLANGPELWTGPDDASFAFSTACDNEYLYVAVAATDDKLVFDPTRKPRGNDGLTVLVDARPRAERATGGMDWKKFVAVIVTPGETAEKQVLAEPGDLPEGTKVASVISPKGHNTEIAIPLKALSAVQGKEWEDVRINVRQHDLDDVTASCTQVYWRPRWDGPKNYKDSGTFRRE